MNMTKTIAVLMTGLLSLLIVSVVVLLVLGKDVSVLVQFASATIIPTVVAFYGASKAEKAADAAEQTVHQTNGRMTELIENNRVLAEKVAALSSPDEAPEEVQVNHMGIPIQKKPGE